MHLLKFFFRFALLQWHQFSEMLWTKWTVFSFSVYFIFCLSCPQRLICNKHCQRINGEIECFLKKKNTVMIYFF